MISSNLSCEKMYENIFLLSFLDYSIHGVGDISIGSAFGARSGSESFLFMESTISAIDLSIELSLEHILLVIFT